MFDLSGLPDDNDNDAKVKAEPSVAAVTRSTPLSPLKRIRVEKKSTDCVVFSSQEYKMFDLS
jgi:hypothetical protein